MRSTLPDPSEHTLLFRIAMPCAMSEMPFFLSPEMKVQRPSLHLQCPSHSVPEIESSL